MANKDSYTAQREIYLREQTRNIVSELPNAAFDFMLSLNDTTQALTRYAYACDLRVFFRYLQKENPRFANKDLVAWTDDDFKSLTARDIALYMDYLTLYFNENDEMTTNQEQGKQRKFYTVRVFFKWLFRQGKITSDISALIDAPTRHEKPILRLDTDEVNRMLNVLRNGERMSAQQQKFNKITSKRDLAIVSLFLGTGIRVSELVGIDIDDINLEHKSFVVTRKGGNQAILYLPDEIIPALSDYIEERKLIEAAEGNENALFLSLQKRRMNVRSVENMVKKYAQVAAPLKRRISPHKLRS
ncbi:MAG: tyrosine-type recombinase/integrase, partial [Clostridia bacterium]|nr:tyrosine-type recombinase/integrase [Clostridia bacterium]